jgi:hypothetical protein
MVLKEGIKFYFLFQKCTFWEHWFKTSKNIRVSNMLDLHKILCNIHQLAEFFK